jgi:transmembrane sensor
MNKYSQFKAEDFITDQDFMDAHKKGPQELAIFQNNILNQFPDREQELSIANILLSHITGNNPQHENDMETEINLAIDEKLGLGVWASNAPRKNARVIVISEYWQNVARYATAACLLLSLVWVFLYKILEPTIGELIVITAGNRKHITLPDGSMVVLNTHSELKYNDNGKGELREVWLKGEAYFKVSKIANAGKPVKFVVHTANLDAEVKGTQFNVRITPKITEVMLEEGRVDIVPINTPEQKVVLKPGLMACLKAGDKQVVTTPASALVHTSWKSNKIIFNNTSMSELVGLFDHNFGKSLLFADTATAAKHVGGTINSESLPVLLEALTKITNTYATISGDTVILKQVDSNK